MSTANITIIVFIVIGIIIAIPIGIWLARRILVKIGFSFKREWKKKDLKDKSEDTEINERK